VQDQLAPILRNFLRERSVSHHFLICRCNPPRCCVCPFGQRMFSRYTSPDISLIYLVDCLLDFVSMLETRGTKCCFNLFLMFGLRWIIYDVVHLRYHLISCMIKVRTIECRTRKQTTNLCFWLHRSFHCSGEGRLFQKVSYLEARSPSRPLKKVRRE
jgi:hypothetical protein